MEVLLAIAIAGAVAAFVAVPLRRAVGSGEEGLEDADMADLEARKEAKYREIRDLELDRAQGKLGEGDLDRIRAELEQEAIAILRRIDELEAGHRGRGEDREDRSG